MRGRRLHCEQIPVGETYNFQDCSVREFTIMPEDGSKPFSYTLHLYGKPVTIKNVILSDGGLNDYIHSCPDDPKNPEDFIGVECLEGPLLLFYKN